MFSLSSALALLPTPGKMIIKLGLFLALFAGILSLFAYMRLSVCYSYALAKDAAALCTAAVQTLVISAAMGVFMGIRYYE